ncbi:MAG TPA: acyl-CoA dehydratase activase [Dissulfurispiraceae bacterium]
MYFVGLDAGSVAVKLVVLDEKARLQQRHYVRHYGHPVKVACDLLRKARDSYPESGLSLTGSAARVIASVLGVTPLNEIVSQSYSVIRLYPRIKTVVELGGEDSKLIFLEDGRTKDFSMNSVCAAGTGSFLEQQAERLKLSIEEFGEMAVKSKRPSKIAGRCSVFAKSDMIHLQQIATPVEDIVAGLCFAVARNFKGSIAKGRELVLPVAFQGGVAANKGMVRAFRETFALDELFIPDEFPLMGALGAALKDMDEGRVNRFDLAKLETFLASAGRREQGYEALIFEGDDFFERHLDKGHGAQSTGRREREYVSAGSAPHSALCPPPSAPGKCFLGIDIGSISTNLAVIDEEGNLLAKRYLMTSGRPIEAVREGLEGIYSEIGDRVKIMGVGTTGSGRYMIADYVGADIVKNEITAQATAAIFIDPGVDTIFEIGGQDSKYISLRNGIIVDFEMNKACAAGTGSFIEEQAEKLDISVKGEFAERSFRTKNPCRLGERCTVFMENSLMANLQKGVDKDSLLAGLAYSIVQNYINRVVAGKPVGDNIFFQGGVAFNKAVVAAFEKYLGRKITVPPNHDVTGAIGMALIAREYMNNSEGPSRFKGFELSRRHYEIDSFECKGCPNVCEINKVKVQGDEGYLFYGGRCEKYDVRRAQKSSLPDLFSFREEMLWKEHNNYSEKVSPSSDRLKIGVPYVFFFHDYLPFWSTLLWELGFEVVTSPKTNRQIINLGVENVLSEACFPVKVAHGHIKYLLDSGVETLFVPSFIDVNQGDPDYPKGLACPHTQTIPYISRAAIKGIKPITPIADMGRGMEYLRKELLKSFKGHGIRIRSRDMERAVRLAQSAQESFRKAVDDKGRELQGLQAQGHPPTVVIIGRAYNAFDVNMNLEIPGKLSRIGVRSIPMDMLPLEREKVRGSWPNMYWRSGQKILKAARIIRNTPGLYAIYLGNFSCGPDSFILKYFKKEMEGKPFLHIEIDEHSADAGAITRCEAFLDSIEQQTKGSNKLQVTSNESPPPRPPLTRGGSSLSDPPFGKGGREGGYSSLKKRTVYIPRMGAHAFALKAAFEHCGISSEVLPESDKESVDIGRKYVSGKECYPYLITTGDMLKKVLSPGFRPGEAAFFMPSGTGPCRFGQYNVSQRLILEELGVKDVPIFAPNQDVEFYKDLGIAGGDFSMVAWRGIVAYDLLTKCLHETRPYERNAGDAEEVYRRYFDMIHRSLRSRNGKMDAALKGMRNEFGSIPRFDERKPLIGIIGEIFVRTHSFSNEDLVKKVEALGGEAWLAPIEEWIYYINAMSLRKALIKKSRSDMMNIFLKRLLQKRVEHRSSRYFKGFLKTLKEPEVRDIFGKASPYVHDSFEGETILSIGKAVDLIEKGASGVISAMPFGCMPGTIVSALLKVIQRDYDIPCVSIPYDGAESPVTALQLEAFMETAKQASRK